MSYSELLIKAIIEADLSLSQISRRLEKVGLSADRTYKSLEKWKNVTSKR